MWAFPHVCLDIDECDPTNINLCTCDGLEVDGCISTCVDTDGAYTCTCSGGGFEVDTDFHTCIGKNTHLAIL